jgi:hypothetical protein
MVRENIPLKSRYLFFRETFKNATALDYLAITIVGKKKATRHEHFYECNPKWMKFLRTWGGGAGTVKVRTDTTHKILDRGVLCMFVVYADNHDGDVYRMWSPKMERAHITRDFIWMKQMMFTKEVDDAMVKVTNESEDREGDEDDETPSSPKTPKAVEDSSSDEESEDDSDEKVPAEED